MICYFLVFAISPTIVRTKAIMQVIVKIFQGKYAGAGEVRISIQSVCPWVLVHLAARSRTRRDRQQCRCIARLCLQLELASSFKHSPLSG